MLAAHHAIELVVTDTGAVTDLNTPKTWASRLTGRLAIGARSAASVAAATTKLIALSIDTRGLGAILFRYVAPRLDDEADGVTRRDGVCQSYSFCA